MNTLNILKKIFVPSSLEKNPPFILSGKGSGNAVKKDTNIPLFYSLDQNLSVVKSDFSYPKNSDIKIREFKIAGEINAFLLFVEGLVRDDSVMEGVLAPLMLLRSNEISLSSLKESLVLTNQIYNAFDDEGNNDIRAVGGTILQYWSKVIVQLERGDEVNKRVATLIRHRSIPEGKQAMFSITSRGII